MIYSDKKILFENFLSKWGEQFEQVPHILRYMASYTQIFTETSRMHLLKPEDLYESQLEWIGLLAQLDHPAERFFFKEYWVPIQSGSYDYFLDLSSENFMIFDADYAVVESDHWLKRHFIKDLKEFYIELDKADFSLENYWEKNFDDWQLKTNFMILEEDECDFSLRMHLETINKSTLFFKDHEYACKIINNTLTIEGVNHLIIAILPYNLEITLINIDATYYDDIIIPKKIKNIKAFICFLQGSSILKVNSYYFRFNSKNGCYAEFKANTFKIKYNDQLLLEDLKEMCEYLRRLPVHDIDN